MQNKNKKQTKKTRIQNIYRLSKRLKPYRWGLVGSVVCGVGQQLFIVAVSAMGAYLVGLAIEGRLLENFSRLVGILALMVAVRVAFYAGEMWLAHDVAFRVLADFRNQLYEAIERVSPAILLNMRSGQLASTLMSDVEQLEWFFAHTFGSVLVAIIAPVVLMIYLGSSYPVLPIILVLFLVIIMWIPLIMKRTADRQGKKVREQLGDANAVTMEGVQGMQEILSMNYKEAYREKNEQYMSRFYDSQLAYGKRLGTEGGLLQGALGLSMLCVTAVAAGLVIRGRIDSSMYPVIVMMAGMILGPVVEVCNMIRNLGLILASADRVYYVLEANAQVEDKGSEKDISALEPRISFENVTFRYREDLEDAVSDVSFTAEPGETVALVGSSGAGKSTCMNLLLRYWDVRKGAIRIGGCDLRDMSIANLRELTSVVLQDVYLFRETIRENIRMGRPEATDEQVEEAARKALAHDFIMDLPEGYDTVAGERGMKLSGGQRQRIAIARAFLKDAPIIILDEAVSNLDTENEKEIQESIRRTSENKTTLIVAHRLSTIRSADKIVVLQDGRAVQTGKFDELSLQTGFFRELIAAQME